MAKGTIAKQAVIAKLADAFGKDFIGEHDKKIYVWTPEKYDADSDEKYAAIYVLDGQSEVNFQNPDPTSACISPSRLEA